MKLFTIILLLLWSWAVIAQEPITISGIIRDAKSGEKLESVNVMLQDPVKQFTVAFSLTDKNGNYRIVYSGKVDTLTIAIMGFNVKKQTHTIRRMTQKIDFSVETEALKIREVVVKAQPIHRKGDTLTYNVSSFINATDRSIGEVLKKMPGIEVTKLGEIKYNGLAINKFYIEGLDMLKGRYGIATNNIQAKDIARVEVMENHQPINLLKGRIIPDKAAINLRLKESAKGVWNGVFDVGIGYKPAVWNAESMAIYLGQQFQNITIYKSNNIGNDVSTDISSHYDGLEITSPLMGVYQPMLPPIDEQRYLNNNIHLVSVNAISKIKKDIELTSNVAYVHDLQKARGESAISYYQPSDDPLVIIEATEVTQRTDRAEVNMQIESNIDNSYFQDKITFAGTWNNDLGNLFNGENEITQHFKLPDIRLKNSFNAIRKFKKFRMDISSVIDYSTQPMSLDVAPILYPEIFDTTKGSILQQVNNKRFRTRNKVSTSLSMKRWDLYLTARINANIERMESFLTPFNHPQENITAANNAQNNISWNRLDMLLGVGVSYYIPDKFFVALNCPFDFMSLRMKDKVSESNKQRNSFYVNPSLSIQLNLTRNLKISGAALYNEFYGGLYDSYSGLIMTDYRVISNKKGEISHTQVQNYSMSLTYANALRALFGSLNVSYHYSKRNLKYGTTFEGALSHIESVVMPHVSDGYELSGNISKRFSSIATTFNLSGEYARSWNKILQQSELIPVSYEQVKLGISTNTRITQAILFNYCVDFMRNRSYVETETALDPINTIQQSGTIDCVLSNKISCSVSGKHYYNSIVMEGSKNLFFLDAEVRYKTKRVEYSIEAYNLFAKKAFSSALYSDVSSCIYYFNLRPATVMFKMKFSLK